MEKIPLKLEKSKEKITPFGGAVLYKFKVQDSQFKVAKIIILNSYKF